jgi:uncharacterized membrane protein YjdF
MKGESWNRGIVWGASFIFILLEIYSVTTNSHYKWDFFFVLGLLWLVYFYQKSLDLHPFHFLLFAAFLVAHNLGTFGFYNPYYFGTEYDMYVHLLFGLSAALILFRGFDLHKKKVLLYMPFMILVLCLGFSAIHELFEFAGALLLGKGEGVLWIGAGDLDMWDTQKDMLFNLVGAIVGLGFYGLKNIFSKTK